MDYIHEKIDVDDITFSVLHCQGNGQCVCAECTRQGKWSLSWTSWFYKITPEDKPLCMSCLKEKLRQSINK